MQTGDEFQNQFLAQLLRSEAANIGAVASRRLVARHPDLARRYHPAPDLKWRDALIGRVNDIAAAVGACSPRLLISQVSWSRAAFEARGVPLDDLRASLRVLADVVREHVPEEDRPLIDEYLTRADAGLEAPPTELSTGAAPGAPLSKLASSYLLSILEGDRVQACAMVRDAAANGATLRELYSGVFQPVLHELGRMWQLGEVNIAEEHFATATTVMAMSQIAGLTAKKPRNGLTMIACAVQGNGHAVGVRMVADYFEQEGWRVIDLGPDVPAEDLALAVADFRADLVAISVALHTQVQTLEDTIRAVRSARGDGSPRVIVGGLAFTLDPDLWKRSGADGFANDLDEAVRIGGALCRA